MFCPQNKFFLGYISGASCCNSREQTIIKLFSWLRATLLNLALWCQTSSLPVEGRDFFIASGGQGLSIGETADLSSKGNCFQPFALTAFSCCHQPGLLFHWGDRGSRVGIGTHSIISPALSEPVFAVLKRHQHHQADRWQSLLSPTSCHLRQSLQGQLSSPFLRVNVELLGASHLSISVVAISTLLEVWWLFSPLLPSCCLNVLFVPSQFPS